MKNLETRMTLIKKEYSHWIAPEELHLKGSPIELIGVKFFRLQIDEAISNFDYHRALLCIDDATDYDNQLKKRLFPKLQDLRDVKKEYIKFMYEFEDLVIFEGVYEHENQIFKASLEHYNGNGTESYVPSVYSEIKYRSILENAGVEPSSERHYSSSYPDQITKAISDIFEK